MPFDYIDGAVQRMDDEVWRRGPSRKIKRSIPEGTPAGPNAYEYVRPMDAYIVCQKVAWTRFSDGGTDVICWLVTEEGQVLYRHVCSHRHYAFQDLWASRPSRQHDHPNLRVDPHAYTMQELLDRHPETARAARNSGILW